MISKKNFSAFKIVNMVLIMSIGFSGLLSCSSQQIQRNSDEAKVCYNRGVDKLKMNNYEEALMEFSKAISFDPQFAEAYNVRAYIYVSKMNKLEEAVSDFSQAIKIQPDNPDIYNHRGWTYWLSGNYEDAFNDYNTAVKLGTVKYAVYFNIGLYYIYCKKDKVKALQYFEKAFDMGCDPYAESIIKNEDKKDDGYYMKDIIHDPDFIKLQKKYKKRKK